MATFTNSVAFANTNGNTFNIWAKPISNFLATAGWIQAGDTGQVVWPVTIINITQLTYVASGNVVTITFTVQSGPSLQVGANLTVNTNGVNPGNQGTFAVVTTNGTTTATYVNAAPGVTATPAANAAWGSVNPRADILAAVGDGVHTTYTYDNLDGTLRPGMRIVITGTAGATFDGTFPILSVALNSPLTGSGTFTVASSVNSAFAYEPAAVGIVTCNYAVIAASASTTVTLPPAASNYVYEIWQMGDGNSPTVFLRINYGASSTPAPAMQMAISATTDGAGNATGGSSGIITVFNSAGTTSAAASYMAGSINRLHLALTPVAGNGTSACFLNIERSHDSSGNDTTQYATICAASDTTTIPHQISISSLNSTILEIHWAALVNHTINTGSFGLSTLLSPVFPLVGAVGNPMLGLLVGKNADWAKEVGTQFAFTMYNSPRNYIIFATANANTWAGVGGIVPDSVATCAVGIRYE